ncbi:MAG TPA: protoporphyrinogen oxidase [Blastocatellia bacterium]|nr:protoporphyrinogen oxidase [Blastocatellia bacterium]
MKNSHRDVVVIGAGLAGLVCAYRLKSLGLDVAVLENSGRVGGVIQSERIDGYLIERGPNSSQGTEELMAIVEELGIMEHVAEGDPKAPAYVFFNRQLHAVPAGPGAFIKSKLLSARGKLRILAEPAVPVRRSDKEESVASFARRRIGSEAAERMVKPFVSGIYAGDAERLSVQAAFPRLANLESRYGGLIRGTMAKAREARQARKSAAAVLDKAAPTRRRLVSFQGGMSFLTDTLAARIGEDLVTGTSDLRFEISDSREEFRVVFDHSGSNQRVAARQVVVAAPSFAAAKLVAPVSNELSGLLEAIEYPPLAILYLSYDKSAIKNPLIGFGFLAAPSEGLNILGCVWNTSLFKDRAPEGRALMTVFIGGARNPEAARLGDAELASVAHGELRSILGISGEPRVVAITRWERAIPQYNLGHRARVERIERLLEQMPGLSLIGNYLHGVSTGDVIKEADRAARSVAEKLNRA